MRGSALQQEVRRVAEIISNDFGVAWQNVQSLIPSETETRDASVGTTVEGVGVICDFSVSSDTQRELGQLYVA